MAGIILSQNGREVRRVELTKNVLIGRASQCDVAIANADRLSREHCRIERLEGGGWRIIDLNSSNGSFFANQKITKHVLRNGDIVQLGVVSLHFFAGALPTVLSVAKAEATAAPKSHDEQVLEMLQAGADDLDESFAGMPVMSLDDLSDSLSPAQPEAVSRLVEKTPMPVETPKAVPAATPRPSVAVTHAPAASSRRIGPTGPNKVNLWDQATVEPTEAADDSSDYKGRTTSIFSAKLAGATDALAAFKSPRALAALSFAAITIAIVLFQFGTSLSIFASEPSAPSGPPPANLDTSD